MNNIAQVSFILFLSCLTLHTSADADVDCASTHAKETCLQQLNRTKADFPEFPFGATDEELNVTCTTVELGLKCIDNYDKHCRQGSVLTNDYNKYMKNLRAVITGICHQGTFQAEFSKHKTCLKTTVPDVTACYAVTQKAMTNLKTATQTGDDSQDYVKTVCCSYRTFMTCLREKTSKCGNEASMYLLGYVNQTAGPIMSYLCAGYVGGCSENH